MADVIPKMPWRVWLKVHTKAICQALPVAFFIVVETKDMYYRATWDVQPMHPSRFSTGDVVAICNRWYTLPTYGHKLYSFVSKALLKSCWDDVGVVVMRDQKPHLLFCEFDGVKEMPLEEFLATRLPRGVAVRPLLLDPTAAKLSTPVADLFLSEVRKMEVHPWYLFNASRRGGEEHKLYELCVAMNAQRAKLRQMCTSSRAYSRQAIEDQQGRLRDLEVMRQHMAAHVPHDDAFRLFNGSLVASFLATFGLLDRQVPAPCRYVPQDFAHDVPFAGTTSLDEPIVFFKS
ncbi:hypothetical protein STCU_03369 [Strigomonas culicis]|nr:hypothetical protein STCU_06140 [Strigomonas culicis]EPY31610.1 hypothetical protein STCU_03369 [Strigomonas culicis]|eukprot:EPY26667.1 hypothetical protein STCU_06140 [Strigomonas culicis]